MHWSGGGGGGGGVSSQLLPSLPPSLHPSLASPGLADAVDPADAIAYTPLLLAAGWGLPQCCQVLLVSRLVSPRLVSFLFVLF